MIKFQKRLTEDSHMVLVDEVMSMKRNQGSGKGVKGNLGKAPSPILGKRVLIVDDSPSQRKKLRELYESMGLVCVGEASNGLECLELVLKARPNLISLDVIMPVMHGIETLTCLRSSKYEGVIIFVSSLGVDESLLEIRPNGFAPQGIFSKSDSRETFMEALIDIFSSGEDRLQPNNSGAPVKETEKELLDMPFVS